APPGPAPPPPAPGPALPGPRPGPGWPARTPPRGWLRGPGCRHRRCAPAARPRPGPLPAGLWTTARPLPDGLGQLGPVDAQLAAPNPSASRSNRRDSIERRLERVQLAHREVQPRTPDWMGPPRRRTRPAGLRD